MSPTLIRQQLALRMHELLLRQIDHEIDAERLLCDSRYARDVLLVCDGSPNPELRALAIQLRQPDTELAPPAKPIGQRPGPQETSPGHGQAGTDWSDDAFDFDILQASSLPGRQPAPTTIPAAAAAPERRRAWLKPWRRG